MFIIRTQIICNLGVVSNVVAMDNSVVLFDLLEIKSIGKGRKGNTSFQLKKILIMF